MGAKSLARRSPKKASQRRRRRKEERPQEILAAAFEEFAANGYAAARLEDVARRGGIAKGTIYLYFKDKEGLFRAVVRSLIHPVLEKLASAGPSDRNGQTRQLLNGAQSCEHRRRSQAPYRRTVSVLGRHSPSPTELVTSESCALSRSLDRPRSMRRSLPPHQATSRRR